MKEKDNTEKTLMDYNDVFADIINIAFFKGERIVEPDSLSESLVHSQYKADDGRLHEMERDVLKVWSQGSIEFAVLGIENQSSAEKFMPLRIFGYEGASYRSMLLKKSKAVKPVITLVLYFGKGHWNQPKSLKKVVNVPEELDSYVNDMKINVLEVSWMKEEQIQLLKSDFKIVANFFVQRRKNSDYIPNDSTEIEHVDELLKLLSVFTEDQRYEEILVDSEREEKTMDEVAERLERIGIEKGRKADIERMLISGKTPKEIADFCGYELEEVVRVEESLLVKN